MEGEKKPVVERDDNPDIIWDLGDSKRTTKTIGHTILTDEQIYENEETGEEWSCGLMGKSKTDLYGKAKCNVIVPQVELALASEQV